MTEWRLQEELTERWGAEPITLGRHSVRLLAWEVMTPSWEVNDSHKRWTEPSVDFLGVSASGPLVAIELKRTWGGQVALAQAASQALASALRVRATVSSGALQSVYDAARAGVIGRRPLDGPALAADAVAQHTGGLTLADMLAAPVVPVVAIEARAPEGASESMARDEILEILEQSRGRESERMRARLVDALGADGTAAGPDVALTSLA